MLCWKSKELKSFTETTEANLKTLLQNIRDAYFPSILNLSDCFAFFKLRLRRRRSNQNVASLTTCERLQLVAIQEQLFNFTWTKLFMNGSPSK